MKSNDDSWIISSMAGEITRNSSQWYPFGFIWERLSKKYRFGTPVYYSNLDKVHEEMYLLVKQVLSGELDD